jgi:hypothetical protein
MFVSWEMGWAFGPYISGIVQQRYGFLPLFIITGILYAAATALQWHLFAGEDRKPIPEAVLAATGN